MTSDQRIYNNYKTGITLSLLLSMFIFKLHVTMHGTGNKYLYVSDSPSLFVIHYPERVNHIDSIIIIVLLLLYYIIIIYIIIIIILYYYMIIIILLLLYYIILLLYILLLLLYYITYIVIIILLLLYYINI